ncbi:MAG: DUF362 domain-containing protein [Anaerolineae bacterium]
MLIYHPVLNDARAVAVMRFAVPSEPQQADFFQAAQRSADILRLSTDCDIAIKPNATAAERFQHPESGIGTHPGFIWGLVEYLRNHGAAQRSIHVVEDPLNVDFGSEPSWEKTGYLELAAATGAILHAPTLETCIERPVRNPQTAPTRRVSQYAVNPGVALINVPKLKTHNLGITTLCLKNLMGLNYGPERHFCSQAMAEMPVDCANSVRTRSEWMTEAQHEYWQRGLARRLADLGQVITPRLNIVEGIVGRDGTGFQHGSNITLGLVVAGINMVAVDSVASYLMGFDPEKLIYLQTAARAGLGSNRLEDLRFYELINNDLVACHSIDEYKANPPFEVNRMLKQDS